MMEFLSTVWDYVWYGITWLMAKVFIILIILGLIGLAIELIKRAKWS